MAKKVAMKNRKAKPKTSRDWVVNREGNKRLTIDVPLSLHARLKIASVEHDQTMGEIVRDCIERYLETGR